MQIEIEAEVGEHFTYLVTAIAKAEPKEIKNGKIILFIKNGQLQKIQRFDDLTTN